MKTAGAAVFINTAEDPLPAFRPFGVLLYVCIFLYFLYFFLFEVVFLLCTIILVKSQLIVNAYFGSVS